LVNIRDKLMTVQIGIKLEPELLKEIKKFARDYGTTVSALMRQATVEFIKRSNSLVYTGESIKQERKVS